MKKGLFISFEGPDGSGKSTQIEYLKTYFKEIEEEAVFTREPGGTLIGEKLREIILDRHNEAMSGRTEALLYAASRAQHIAEVIAPALDAGKIVVCDRFVDSSIAYQGYGRGLGDGVRVINEFAIEGCIPDLTFFLDLDPAVGKSRINAQAWDRLEKEELSFHRRVYKGYREQQKRDGQRFVLLDATASREEIHREIVSKLARILEDRRSSCR